MRSSASDLKYSFDGENKWKNMPTKHGNNSECRRDISSMRPTAMREFFSKNEKKMPTQPETKADEEKKIYIHNEFSLHLGSVYLITPSGVVCVTFLFAYIVISCDGVCHFV